MARFINRIVDAQASWAKPLGDVYHRVLAAVFRPIEPVKEFLHGRWLGTHPLHGALTDIPIGALTVAVVLDLLGQHGAADVALVIGVLGMVASAASGSADYVDTFGRAGTKATVHATIMVVGLVVLLVSLLLRAGAPADRTPSVVLLVLGYLIVAAGAYVGGDVVYALGNMVDRHAWLRGGAKWGPLTIDGGPNIPEGVPTKARAGSTPLVLVRLGPTIHALHDTCAHAGGPLAEGQLVDGCIECPWHGSRFRLADGAARRGPTLYDQPVYDIRAAESGVGYEVRRRPTA